MKTVVKRLDYKKPDYVVDGRVSFEFNLDETATEVTAMYQLRRASYAPKDAPLKLHLGSEVVLESLQVDGQYSREGDVITATDVPSEFFVKVVTIINPKENSALEGLFLSGGMLITQCEAEGFRKITAFPDRPDVMAPFVTVLVGDKDKYPVLLSNGNLIDSGDIQGTNNHYAVWDNPFKMPCYLFAVVACNLAVLKDTFTTMSGRVIELAIYAEKRDVESGKCDHAMASLKNSMAWDEEEYGRECDVDTYMIVATPHFNMGAMENKGLNVFNTRLVLVSPETGTDEDYETVESVIGHEYFHNWTGNRITCRDWFNLCLKEGFTVFRDQEFSRKRRGLPITIRDITSMRGAQFAEDAGPSAHPVRPEEYQEINNFYTLTVYNKGAENFRMLSVMLGKEGFRNGSDLYFERHDGEAVGVDELVSCMSDANDGVDLTQFMNWFSYAGTPVVQIHTTYLSLQKTLMMTVLQSCPATPGQSEKPEFYIPLQIGFVHQDCDMRVTEESGAYDSKTGVLHITKHSQTFVFSCPEAPALSLNRGGAPVKVQYNYREGELAFLMANDLHSVGRWEASQKFASQVLLRLVDDVKAGRELRLDPSYLGAVKNLIEEEGIDPNLLAAMLSLPSETDLANQSNVVDPSAIHLARQVAKFELGMLFIDDMSLYHDYADVEQNPIDHEPPAVAKRAVANIALSYMAAADTMGWIADLVSLHFLRSTGMEDRLTALKLLVHQGQYFYDEFRDSALLDFYDEFKDDGNVVLKWLSVQVTSPRVTVEEIQTLMRHPAFDIGMPNHIYSVVRSFTRDNPAAFHNLSGEGYQFLADFLVGYVQKNPLVAARIVDPLLDWKRYEPVRSALMKKELIHLQDELSKLSPEKTRGLLEKVDKALAE
jgi:aminopeptidase N